MKLWPDGAAAAEGEASVRHRHPSRPPAKVGRAGELSRAPLDAGGLQQRLGLCNAQDRRARGVRLWRAEGLKLPARADALQISASRPGGNSGSTEEDRFEERHADGIEQLQRWRARRPGPSLTALATRSRRTSNAPSALSGVVGRKKKWPPAIVTSRRQGQDWVITCMPPSARSFGNQATPRGHSRGRYRRSACAQPARTTSTRQNTRTAS